MNISNFDFTLPDHLIAQAPAPERDLSKMMVVWQKTGKREHRIFRDLPEILDSNSFLVINNTRVFPARLRASRPARREEIEILLLEELCPPDWLALVKPARKAPPGQELIIGDLRAKVLEAKKSGCRLLRFETAVDLKQRLDQLGEPPIPPYIHRQKGQDLTQDKLRYQTVYARKSGSVAAPTAGLHFTEEIFRRLKDRGIPVCELLLHVGYGTFKPVRCENITKHLMDPEHYEIDSITARNIRNYKSEGRSLIAVGTTTTRCLEFLAKQENDWTQEMAGLCDLFIYPGFEFRMLDGLITNFHLPRSTLLALVAAFAGLETILRAYKHAVEKRYRFYSYGDAMLII